MKKHLMKKTSSFFCNRIIISIILIILLFCLAIFTSCELLGSTTGTKTDIIEEETSQQDLPESSEESTVETTTQTTAEDSEDQTTQEESSSQTSQAQTPEGMTIKAYYANADASALVGEDRIVKGTHKYLEAFLELQKSPINPGLISLVPVEAKVKRLTAENGNIDLDLSQEFLDQRFASDTADILLLYSIVNTLTEFSEINTVTFYFEGVKADIFGQLDISEPIFRNESLIHNE